MEDYDVNKRKLDQVKADFMVLIVLKGLVIRKSKT